MVKVKSVFLTGMFLFGFLIMVSFVAAADSADGLLYHPRMDVMGGVDGFYVVTVKDAATGNSVKSFKVDLGPDGRWNEKVGTNSELVNVKIYTVKTLDNFTRDENVISVKEVGPFATNQTLSVNIGTGIFNTIKDEEPEPVVNDTVVNETVVEEVNDTVVVEAEPEVEIEEIDDVIPDTEEGGFTGMAIFDWENTSSKVFYGVLGVVVLGFVAFLFVKKGGFGSSNSGGESREPRVAKLSEMSRQASGERLEGAERKLERAQKDLKEAQAEIMGIKNRKTELSDAEKAFEAAKANLDKLKESKQE